jgi:L-fucose isomerase-like protein
MPTSNTRSTKLGLIVGNRGFFPDHLAASGREEMIRVLKGANVEVIAPTPKGSNADPTLIANESKFGAVETFEEAKGCAELFKRHRDTIDGVIVSLPNFGGAGHRRHTQIVWPECAGPRASHS